MSGAGTLLGAAAAWPVARLMSAFLFEVTAFDPATVATVAGILCGISAAASFVPVWRVFRLDPVRIVNSE
jgi:ABC-type antimicrobial peptide transport system permease subunit